MDIKASHLKIEDQTLYSMQYRGRLMILQAGIRLTPSVNDATVKNLLLVQRETRKELFFPMEIVATEGDGHLLQTDIDFLQYPGMDREEGIWDLFITVEIGEDCRRFRLKGNDQTLEMQLFADSDWTHLMVPYLTDHGNVSFQVMEKHIYAGIEEANIRKKMLTLQGYAFYPWGKDQLGVLPKELVLKNEDGIVEKRIHMTEYTTDHTKKQDKWTWFKAQCDLEKWQIPGGMGRLKFYIVVGSGLRTMESEAIRFKSEASMKTAFLKKNGQKVTLKGKANKTVSMTVSGAKPIKGLYTFVKKKLIQARSGKKAQVIYHLLFQASALLLTKRKNLVMFESFLGKQYSCNPRAIYDYMRKHYPDYQLCWSVGKNHTQQFKDNQVPYVQRYTLKWLWYMPRAGYWVINSRMPSWVPKPPKTVYLQTWHGTPLKRLAADMDEVHMPATNEKKYKRNFVKAAGKWDYLISPNAYSSVIFWHAFRFNGEILETGYPRNDYLYTHNTRYEINKLRRKCGIPVDKKVLLYAPTWRDDQFYMKGFYKFDLSLDLDRMQKALGDEYVILLRMHYLVAQKLDLDKFSGFAYDYSRYEDIRDLYLISDLMITDYSSVIFDFANLYRPIIFYTYDLERYRDRLRGFYFNLEEEAPGPLVKTTEGVIAAIRHFERNHYRVPDDFKAFYDKFCYLEDGQAAGRVVERVFAKEPAGVRKSEKQVPQIR